jgi:hypothetical protein
MIVAGPVPKVRSVHIRLSHNVDYTVVSKRPRTEQTPTFALGCNRGYVNLLEIYHAPAVVSTILDRRLAAGSRGDERYDVPGNALVSVVSESRP